LVALRLRRTAKDGIGRLQTSDQLQTCRLCDWKCIFLQWIVGSIFLKSEYPRKYNKINRLRAAILCKVAGAYSGLPCGKSTNRQNVQVCHEAGRPNYQAF